jgi:hypothetical protein
LALGISPGGLPAAAENYQPNANVGDLPDDWTSNIDRYRLLDILHLVIFYNDDFGIDAGDPLDLRKGKLRDWLTGRE